MRRDLRSLDGRNLDVGISIAFLRCVSGLHFQHIKPIVWYFIE
jgi:hypothetical protein